MYLPIYQRRDYCYEQHLKSIAENGQEIVNSEISKIESDKNFTKMDQSKSPFTDFCQSTGLHGWQHLSECTQGRSGSHGRYFWIVIVVVSIGAASFFLLTSVADFTSKFVVTNIDTTTAPLKVCKNHKFFCFVRFIQH